MPIDSSIYFQQQPLDIAGAIDRGLSMRQMLDQRKKQQDMQDAYKAGIVQQPDGTSSFNSNATISDLAKRGYGQEAMALQKQANEDALNKQKLQKEKNLETANFVASAAPKVKENPQAYYPVFLAEAKNRGLDTSSLPPVWNDDAAKKMDYYHGTALSLMDQHKVDQDKAELGLKQQDLGIKQQNANTEAKKATTMAGYKTDSNNQKMADSLKKDMDADAGRTGNFGLVSKKVLQAQNLETLANAFPDGNLDSRQIEELSLGLANMLSGSSGAARSQVEALVPHTWTGKMANIQEWLTSDPKGAGQQEFVKRMMHTIEREKQTSLDQLNQIREQRLSSHKQYSKADPEGFKSILQSYGLNPDDYDQNLLRKNKSSGQQNSNATATVRMRDPKGNIRDIPVDQVGEAIAAGGSKL